LLIFASFYSINFDNILKTDSIISRIVPKHLQKQGLQKGVAELKGMAAQAAQPVGAGKQVGNAALLFQRREGDFKT